MARLENVDLSNSVNAWRMKTNLTASYVGDLDDLNTTDSGSIVGAVNSIQNKFALLVSSSPKKLGLQQH